MLINLEPKNRKTPLYQQVYEAIRQAIVAETLQHNHQLPPSRELAQQLNLSRNTVNAAYAQLCAEGYIVSRQGSGYFVSAQLPTIIISNTQPKPGVTNHSTTTSFSKRGAYLARPTRPVPTITNPAFQPGLPDLSQFPFSQWRRCLGIALKQADQALFKYSDQGGYLPLKQALHQYLSQSRGVRCQPEQIIIVNGSQAGLDLIARLLVDDNDTIAIEEPGYLGARDGFLAAGAYLEPIPVDEEGLQVHKLLKKRKSIRLAYTTPSYQFPLGVTLSLQRRLQLLEWAQTRNSFIIEDDYDSEFRFRGRPLSCLQGLANQGLDNADRVIYFGTFSKVMFPGLRMGYLVVPATMADGFAKALRKTGQDAPLQLQAGLTEFINQGFFTSHIRKMRTLYSKKQQLLVDLAEKHLSDWLSVQATDAGMQVPAFFTSKIDVDAVLNRARDLQLALTPLQNYYLGNTHRPGLFLGYAGVELAKMELNVKILKQILQAVSTTG